jgi:zeta-carotene desaturase
MNVAVVGAGFAGLAAAIKLQERRHNVTLFERRGVLGGRASSYADALTGEDVDSGANLLCGASRSALALLQRAGAAELLHFAGEFAPELLLESRRSRFAAFPLPAPWHLPFAALRLPLPWRARVSALRALLRLGRGPAGTTLGAYLSETAQSPEARRVFWEPFCTLLANDAPERVALEVASRVAAELAARHEAACVLPARKGFGRIHERLARYFEGRGGRIRRRALVERLLVEGGRVARIAYVQRPESREEIRLGKPPLHESLAVDAAVLAVPWKSVPPLLPDAVRGDEPFASVALIASAPAVSVELWLDRPVLSGAIVALPGSEVAWVFDKGRLHGSAGGAHLSCVMSPAARAVERPKAEWQQLALAALRRHAPVARDAALVRALVLRDADGVFSCDPESQRRRPGAATPVRGLYLAGDWTATGLPACIEGAARSGFAAAAALDAGAT